MRNRSFIHPHFYLSLSLAIASIFVANSVQAESTPPTPTIGELSQKIAKLIDLEPDRQILITSALNRAIASKETPTGTTDKIKTTIQIPIVRGRYIRPIDPPPSMELGYIANPKNKIEKTDVPQNPSTKPIEN
jgi:hypothetical protein